MGNLRDSIRSEVDLKELRKKVIECRIDEYERIRYVNMLRELKLVESILESVKGDEQLTAKYKAKWEELNEERKDFMNKTVEKYNNEHKR